MELIERYVVEVGRHLPQKQRADVQTELRSLLEDMVEDRAQTKVDKADETVVVEVLQEFGHPEKVAASYQLKKQYLIGPQLFPIFKIVLTVVTAVLGAITLLGIMLTMWSSDASLLTITQKIVWAIPDFIGSMMSAVGSIVVVFFLIERLLPDEAFDEETEEWDPRSLPEVNDTQLFKRSELIASIVFTTILLLLFNAFPQWAGIVLMHNEEVMFVPLFSANFYANLLPWVNALLLSSIGMDVYKMRLGRRTRLSQLLEIALNLFTAVIAAILMTYGPIFGFNEALAEASSFPNEGIDVIVTMLNWGARLILPIIILTQLWSAAKNVYDFRQIPQKGAAPSLVNKMG